MEMESSHWPTFGELLQYLREKGFTVGPGKPGYIIGEHPQEDCWFVFRDRDPTTPARETELVNLRTQFTYRGFATDEEFARFWNPAQHANPYRASPP
jgi:hypothetical protein